jgi:hypothetical protein
VKSFAMRYRGRDYVEPGRLLADCCGWVPEAADKHEGVAPAGVPIISDVVRTVVKAGEKRNILRLDYTPANETTWKRLNVERFRIAYSACYCSVFGTCWRSDLTGVDPKEVKACPA